MVQKTSAPYLAPFLSKDSPTSLDVADADVLSGIQLCGIQILSAMQNGMVVRDHLDDVDAGHSLDFSGVSRDESDGSFFRLLWLILRCAVGLLR